MLPVRESLELKDKECPAQRDYSVENSGTMCQGKKLLMFHNQERDRDYFLKCPLCTLSPFSLTSVKTSSRIKFFEPSKMESAILRIFCKICGKKKKKKESRLREGFWRTSV